MTTAGSVQQTPIDPALFPALPARRNTGLKFDLSTRAAFTKPAACLNASSFIPAQFANLKIYHLESGVWQNRTTGGNVYPDLCTNGDIDQKVNVAVRKTKPVSPSRANPKIPRWFKPLSE